MNLILKGGLVTNLKRIVRQLRCKHTHTFRKDLAAPNWYNIEGKPKGLHMTLQVQGCYICGLMRVVDYGA